MLKKQGQMEGAYIRGGAYNWKIIFVNRKMGLLPGRAYNWGGGGLVTGILQYVLYFI